VTGQQGIGDASQLHPARHPRQQIRSLARRERLRPGSGRERQHHLPAVGAARQGRPGGQHLHRTARVLAQPAERDRCTIVKR